MVKQTPQTSSRLGDLICTLPSSDMKEIDASLGRTLGIMKYYADIQNQLQDKLTYISRIKEDRNSAQNEIAEVKKIIGLSETDSLVVYYKTHLDKQ